MRVSGPLMVVLALAACSDSQSETRNAKGRAVAAEPATAPEAAAAGLDCARAAGQAEQAVCGDRELRTLDLLSGDADENFRAARQACGRDDDLKACLVNLYAQRIVENAQRGQLDGAVVGPVAFVCGAETLSAAFINAGAGYVVLKSASGTAVLTRSSAESGGRYEGRAGAEPWSFWEKGEEAGLSRGERETSCTQAKAAPAPS